MLPDNIFNQPGQGDTELEKKDSESSQLELYQLLMEIGYTAGGRGFFKESKAIFDALTELKPASEYPHIGLSVTLLNEKKYEDAVKILRDNALKINPDSDLAKSFLGFALKLAGLENESRTVLEEVISLKRDNIAVKMAESILESPHPPPGTLG